MGTDTETRRIIARKRDLNGRGNGTEEHRQVILPDESEPRWASDAGEVSGEWASSRGSRADERQCKQMVRVPVGTVVIAYDSTLRGYQKTGPAQITVGVLLPATGIHWGIPYTRNGQSVVPDLERARATLSERSQSPEVRRALLEKEAQALRKRLDAIEAELAVL